MRRATADGTAASAPPIVLLIDDDRDTLEMYHAYFESSGVWVSTCMVPGEAVDAANELLPDVVVTDIGFAGRPDGEYIVHTLKHTERTRHIPVIVLTGREPEALPGDVLANADICLVKPVLPDALLAQVQVLLARSRELRSRNTAARRKAATLRRKSQSLIGRGRTTVAGSRACPECHHALEWIETGRLDGADLDYFRWCASGCGLYSYNRANGSWIKLA